MTPLQRARDLRKTMSPPETRLWRELRQRPGGFQFRRQQPAEPYVLDFFCKAAALAIEVDGAAHDMGCNPERDLRRDALLAGRGVKTLRIPAIELLHNLEEVVTLIVEECASRTPSTGLRPSPSPRNRGEES